MRWVSQRQTVPAAVAADGLVRVLKTICLIAAAIGLWASLSLVALAQSDKPASNTPDVSSDDLGFDLHGYARAHKECAVWTDKCVNCWREVTGGPYSCSNIGIACQPGGVTCVQRFKQAEEHRAAPQAWCTKWIDDCSICTRDHATGSVTCSDVHEQPLCGPARGKSSDGCLPTPSECVSGVHCLEPDRAELKNCQSVFSDEIVHCNTCDGAGRCTQMACPHEVICWGYKERDK